MVLVRFGRRRGLAVVMAHEPQSEWPLEHISNHNGNMQLRAHSHQLIVGQNHACRRPAGREWPVATSAWPLTADNKLASTKRLGVAGSN
jgi:hypothetical protein